MSNQYKFKDSSAQIEKNEKGYSANCQCGWSSEIKKSKEEAIIDFENHVRYDPRHKIRIEESRTNISSLLLASLGIIYIIIPFDLVPDTLMLVGWIEDILIGIISIMLIKEGLNGKSPTDVLKDLL